jgi:endonuclease/exonuclease/phosphatase family metal-dependent hydrolase
MTCENPIAVPAVHRTLPPKAYRWTKVIAAALMLLAVDSSFAEADELPETISVATWNVEWFFDNDRSDNRSDIARQMAAPTFQDWEWRLAQVAQVLGELRPTIVALQEVENRDVLYRLCRALEEGHGVKYRIAFIPGYDFATEQEVALLYQSGLVEYSRREQSREMYDSGEYYNLSKHLFGRFEWGSGPDRQSLLVATAHFRATPESADLRQRQARLLRRWLETDLSNERSNVIVLGDFNAEEFAGAESPGCEMRILTEPGSGGAGLADLTGRLDPSDRWTHLANKPFDRILVSDAMLADGQGERDFVFRSIRNARNLVIRGEKDLDHRNQYFQIDADQRDVSDHYPLVADFVIQ